MLTSQEKIRRGNKKAIDTTVTSHVNELMHRMSQVREFETVTSALFYIKNQQGDRVPSTIRTSSFLKIGENDELIMRVRCQLLPYSFARRNSIDPEELFLDEQLPEELAVRVWNFRSMTKEISELVIRAGGHTDAEQFTELSLSMHCLYITSFLQVAPGFERVAIGSSLLLQGEKIKRALVHLLAGRYPIQETLSVITDSTEDEDTGWTSFFALQMGYLKSIGNDFTRLERI